MNKRSLKEKSQRLYSNKINHKNMSSIRLRKALKTIAFLIDAGQENLWPLFDKLDDELNNIESRKERLSVLLK